MLGALFRWLIEQRYVLADPFAGVKVRGTHPAGLDAGRVFTEGDWNLLRTVADGLEWSYTWEAAAAQRLRFVLDFGYSTGLRVSELVGSQLGDIETDAYGDHWLNEAAWAKAVSIKMSRKAARKETAPKMIDAIGRVRQCHIHLHRKDDHTSSVRTLTGWVLAGRK